MAKGEGVRGRGSELARQQVSETARGRGGTGLEAGGCSGVAPLLDGQFEGIREEMGGFVEEWFGNIS
jgi:hypothetical protein